MKTVTTYLSFDGNCRQAMSFYRDCLAIERVVSPVAIDCDSGDEADRLFAALSRDGEVRMP